MRTLVSLLMATVLVGSLVGCGDRALTTPSGTSKPSSSLGGQISEVSPPEVIQQLRPALESYQPQVAILSPQTDEVLQATTVAVRLQVRDLPIFKDPQLGLGPHLHVILDNQPYKAIYDLEQPLVFEDLAPGTHTLRVFASRPWHESFKNEGAYAQTTFHLFTKTTDNNPDPGQPLLTYSRPTGSYGAEPIMLDFYLTNAPLHLVAQSNPDDEIADWRVRVTVNGQSFVMDRWQPLYLKGFNSGKNWVQLEFLDEQGNPVTNVFNNTVRLITYEPKGKDTLAKLVRGELSAIAAGPIVNPNYSGKTPVPTATPEPSVTPTPEPLEPPVVEETPAPQLGKEEPTPSEVEPAKPSEAPPAAKQLEKPQGGFFNRFRRPETPVSPPPALPVPEAVEEPSPLPTPPENIPKPGTLPEITPSPEASPEVETAPSTPPAPPAAKQLEKPKGGFFNRFRRPDAGVATPTPNLPPTLPEIVPSPTPEEPQSAPSQPESSLQPLPSPQPTASVKQKTEQTTQSAQSSPTSAQAKPKVDFNDLLIPKPAAAPPLRIIQAPSEPDIPSSFFQKSKPAAPEPEAPAEENTEDELGEAATP